MRKNEGIRSDAKVLIVGLGNPQILADSLGNKVLEKIDILPSKKDNKIFKFAPNVFLATGVKTFDLVYMLVVWLNVDYVIIVDSLATINAKRLGVSIQLNSAGLTPGSAVNKLGSKISKDTVGVPCFAIGVPLMLVADKVIDNSLKDMLLVPKDIHENIDTLSYIISSSIKQLLGVK